MIQRNRKVCVIRVECRAAIRDCLGEIATVSHWATIKLRFLANSTTPPQALVIVAIHPLSSCRKQLGKEGRMCRARSCLQSSRYSLLSRSVQRSLALTDREDQPTATLLQQ